MKYPGILSIPVLQCMDVGIGHLWNPVEDKNVHQISNVKTLTSVVECRSCLSIWLFDSRFRCLIVDVVSRFVDFVVKIRYFFVMGLVQSRFSHGCYRLCKSICKSC